MLGSARTPFTLPVKIQNCDKIAKPEDQWSYKRSPAWPSKTQNIHNLENIWIRNDLDFQYSHTFIISISCLHLPTFRSQAAIVFDKSLFSLFPIEKP